MTDSETTTAVEFITRNLRGLNLRGADPEVVALELITGLRARGWRPTEARPIPAWQRPTGSGRPPTDGYLAARAELDERLGHHEEAS